MGAVSQSWMEVQMFPASQTMVFKSFHVNDKVHGKKKLGDESFNERYI